jgi:peptidoglycan/xylan/chitin deacetylase (PgdA/CDA1 family)
VGDKHDGSIGTAADLGRLGLGQVPMILMYHCVQEVPEDPHRLCVTPARFAEQMSWLREHGLRGVGMGTLVDAMAAGREQGLVGITFDDGYVNILENALPELQRHEFTATMFIISDLLGGTNEWDASHSGPVWPLMSAGQVAELAAAGMEVGAHSATHVRLAGIGADRLAAEVSGSRSTLSELVGHAIRGFAYPWGNMDAAARRAVRDAGYHYACSVESPLSDLGIMALPRITFTQRDGAGRLAVKRRFYRSYLAYEGTKRSLSYNPHAQQAKRQVSALARPLRRS